MEARNIALVAATILAGAYLLVGMPASNPMELAASAKHWLDETWDEAELAACRKRNEKRPHVVCERWQFFGKTSVIERSYR